MLQVIILNTNNLHIGSKYSYAILIIFKQIYLTHK